MFNKSKLIIVAAIVAAGLVSPALARTQHRTDRVIPESGLHAFATVPYAGFGSFSPAATGGGSIGYNENIRKDQW